MLDNWRENSPIKRPVYPHVEHFFHPDANIAWDHFIKYHEYDENARTIYESLGQAFNHFDIIIVQGLGYTYGLDRLLELKLKYPKTKLLMELDDNFDEPQPSNTKAHQVIKDHFNVHARQAHLSDGIIVSTEYLKKKLSKYNDNIYVLPNAVYQGLENWQYKKPKTYEREYVDYAYVGAGGHDEDLKILNRAIRPLLDEGFKFGIYYSGYRPDFLTEHENLIFETWSHHISVYYQELLKINAGSFVAPLRDTEFNRCKSNIKVLEAQMCGKRIITSDVEPYKEQAPAFRVNNDPEHWRAILRLHKNKPESKIRLKGKYKIERVATPFLHYLNKMIS